MQKAILTHYNQKILLLVLEDHKAKEIQLYDDNPYPVGTIFRGRIQRVVQNISASFVDIAPKKKGFLPKTCYKGSSLVTVQIVKEGTHTKDPELTDTISISGKYAVVYAEDGEVHVSSKLSEPDKKQLLSALSDELQNIPNRIILRTNAVNVDPKTVMREILSIKETLDRILQYASSRPVSVLYRPDEEWVTAVAGLNTADTDEIVTDEPKIYEDLCTHFADQEQNGVKIRLYEDPSYPLAKLYSVSGHLSDALSKYVWLKSGAQLVIEKTEALISIDVNSSKVSKGSDQEETFAAVNKEAAVEIARQLRLRNLSGIILIDFINMKSYQHQTEVLETLRNALKSDPVKTQVHGMTKLGLVEMTRMKGRRSLYEQTGNLSYDAALSGDKGEI